MTKIAVFLADGCEEIEALAVVDLLRRAGIMTDMLSVKGGQLISGSHGIIFRSDMILSEVDLSSYDGIILPGGLTGTKNLKESEKVISAVQEFAASGKLVAAICAAPSVLAKAGILEGKHATSYPGVGEQMPGCIYETDTVVCDGNLITSRGMGTAIDFGLAIVAYFKDEAAAESLADKIVYGKKRA